MIYESNQFDDAVDDEDNNDDDQDDDDYDDDGNDNDDDDNCYNSNDDDVNDESPDAHGQAPHSETKLFSEHNPRCCGNFLWVSKKLFTDINRNKQLFCI